MEYEPTLADRRVIHCALAAMGRSDAARAIQQLVQAWKALRKA